MGREVHIGVVVNNVDPKMQGRIQAKIPALTGDDIYPEWIQPKFPLAGDGHGMFFLPEIGDQVNIDLVDGEQSIEDPDPFWSHSEFKLGDIPKTFSKEMAFMPKFKALVTKAGHRFVLVDMPGVEKMVYEHPNGSKIEIDGMMNISVTHPSGAVIKFDPIGNISVFASLMVKIGIDGGAFEPIAQGIKTVTNFTTIQVAFDAHLHPTAFGPSGTPVAPIGALPPVLALNGQVS